MNRQISIHAPLRERRLGNSQLLVVRNFNPRSLTGATLISSLLFGDVAISIHAPLRERLLAELQAFGQLPISIHAPLRERPKSTNSQRCPAKFQSTLPYGSDPRKDNYYWLCKNFNPRSLTGATGNAEKLIFDRTISIHAPLRERPITSGWLSASSDFNPRSLTGATKPPELQQTLFGFQSTLPYGSDNLMSINSPKSSNFNPRSLTGATA